VRRVCFYHAGCPDGFGAAWAVRAAWRADAEYRARGHDDPLHAADFAGAEVVFVDIALPNADLRALATKAARVVVLDHHVSALERFQRDPDLGYELESRGHLVRFDLGHSGAMLAWRHFHPDAPPPKLLAYVEDQDLWRWKLPDSDAVNAAIGSYPRRFEVWDRLAAEPIDKLAGEGRSLVRAQKSEVERALLNVHPVQVGELRLEAVNALFQRSMIGHELAKRGAHGAPCGLVYRVIGRRVECSLYSLGDFDVARIASALGGGGHRNAAGFSVPLEEWTARFLPAP
jgi:oligoribonuclease NrnB/cAMP/cGMP phosphodiesterase (DHH superfamily)